MVSFTWAVERGQSKSASKEVSLAQWSSPVIPLQGMSLALICMIKQHPPDGFITHHRRAQDDYRKRSEAQSPHDWRRKHLHWNTQVHMKYCTSEKCHLTVFAAEQDDGTHRCKHTILSDGGLGSNLNAFRKLLFWNTIYSKVFLFKVDIHRLVSFITGLSASAIMYITNL